MNDISRWSIGIFDSGIGGLTVLRATKRLLPGENIIYLGDTARVPYGSRSPETIVRYSRENARFLMEKGIKLLVVACNTSSAVALSHLKKNLPIEVIGVVEPGARRAVQVSREGKIGVIGTEATITSLAYKKAIKRFRKSARVFSKACPLFVPLVEEGIIQDDITYAIAEKYLSCLKMQKIDTLILGCTHYPVLKKVIQDIIGDKVSIVDSAEEVARVVKRTLARKCILNDSKKGSINYFVTDAVERFTKIGKIFMDEPINGAMQTELT